MLFTQNVVRLVRNERGVGGNTTVLTAVLGPISNRAPQGQGERGHARVVAAALPWVRARIKETMSSSNTS